MPIHPASVLQHSRRLRSRPIMQAAAHADRLPRWIHPGPGDARWLVLGLVCGLLAAGAGLRATARPPAPAPQPRIDRDGDPLPQGALARLGTMRFRSSAAIFQVAFSPDGKQVAAAGTGQGVEVFDRATGRRVLSGGGYAHAQCTAFSPDGTLLAVPGLLDNKHWTVRLLSLATGGEVRRFAFHDKGITCLAFSPDGRQFVSGSNDETVAVADVATGKLLHRLKGHTGGVVRLAFSPDGQTLASANRDGTVHLWGARTGLEQQGLVQTVPKGSRFPDIVFARDDRTIITGTTLGVRLWDLRTATTLRALASRFGPAQAIALSPDGKTLALGNDDGEIATWAMDTGEQQHRWQGAVSTIYSLAFAPDGKTLASGAGTESTIRLWDPASGRELNPGTDHRGAIMRLAFSKDGRALLSADSNGRVCRWDPDNATGRGYFDVPGHGRTRFALAADLSTVVARGDSESTVRVFVVRDGRLVRTLDGIPATPAFRRQLGLSPDGRTLVSGAFFDPLVVQNAATGKEIHRLSDERILLAAAFSADSRLLATAEGRSKGAGPPAIHLWEVASGRELRQFNKGGAAGAVTFSRDGRLLAAGLNEGQGVKVWETETGKEVRRFPSRAGYIWAIAFSSDTRLLTFGDSDVHVWEMASGGEARRFVGHRNGVTALAFAPDGRTLASAGDDPILLWDMFGHDRRARDAADLNKYWADLGLTDPGLALDAVYTLAATPDLAVPFLNKQLRSVRAFDAQHFARLVADLDSPRFGTRQRATAELERTDENIEPAVRERLQALLTLEARQRLEQVLQSISGGTRWFRHVRALQVLEDIGSPQARAVIARLATGVAEARLTQEARHTLMRMTGGAP